MKNDKPAQNAKTAFARFAECQAAADLDGCDYVLYSDGTYEPMRDAAMSRAHWIIRSSRQRPAVQ